MGPGGTPAGGGAIETRVLVSEFALVRVEDADRTLWLAFRDVVDVDGRPVRDREERLQRLFRTTPANTLAQDVKTKGLLWIDPGTGRVLKSELDAQIQRGLRARITTIYAPDKRLPMT